MFCRTWGDRIKNIQFGETGRLQWNSSSKPKTGNTTHSFIALQQHFLCNDNLCRFRSNNFSLRHVWKTNQPSEVNYCNDTNLCCRHDAFNCLFADSKLPQLHSDLCCSDDAFNCLFADASHCCFWSIDLQWIVQNRISSSVGDSDTELPTTKRMDSLTFTFFRDIRFS